MQIRESERPNVREKDLTCVCERERDLVLEREGLLNTVCEPQSVCLTAKELLGNFNNFI